MPRIEDVTIEQQYRQQLIAYLSRWRNSIADAEKFLEAVEYFLLTRPQRSERGGSTAGGQSTVFDLQTLLEFQRKVQNWLNSAKFAEKNKRVSYMRTGCRVIGRRSSYPEDRR